MCKVRGTRYVVQNTRYEIRGTRYEICNTWYVVHCWVCLEVTSKDGKCTYIGS